MSSGFFSNNADLDTIFELASEFPGLGSTQFTSNYFAPGNQDLASRYIQIFTSNSGPAANTGFIVNTPFIPAWTERLNEGGEVIIIEHPAIPASSNDLSALFAKKGTVWAYYNYPRAFPPPSNELTFNLDAIVSNQSGSVVGSRLFSLDALGVILSPSVTITEVVFVSTQVISGSVYRAVSKGSLTRDPRNSVRFLQRFTIGLSTNTTYSNGAGASQARTRITMFVRASNGLNSNDAGGLQNGANITFDVVLNHTVTFSDGGGGPIQ
jgi:hypothetical protein